MIGDLHRHLVFLVSFGLGLMTGLAFWWLGPNDRALIGADAFFALYLAAAWFVNRKTSAADLRLRGDAEDEGMPVIAALAIGAVTISITAIFDTLRAQDAGFAARPWLAVASVPLGWAMIHTVFAFHYAGLWYARGDDGRDARGLEFPGETHEARLVDFLYYSFTIGLTAQTSDVAVRTPNLRRVTILHAGLSFFYNTVILALAVNMAVSLGQ